MAVSDARAGVIPKRIFSGACRSESGRGEARGRGFVKGEGWREVAIALEEGPSRGTKEDHGTPMGTAEVVVVPRDGGASSCAVGSPGNEAGGEDVVVEDGRDDRIGAEDAAWAGGGGGGEAAEEGKGRGPKTVPSHGGTDFATSVEGVFFSDGGGGGGGGEDVLRALWAKRDREGNGESSTGGTPACSAVAK